MTDEMRYPFVTARHLIDDEVDVGADPTVRFQIGPHREDWVDVLFRTDPITAETIVEIRSAQRLRVLPSASNAIAVAPVTMAERAEEHRRRVARRDDRRVRLDTAPDAR